MIERAKILQDIKDIDKEAFYELVEVSSDEISNEELLEIYEEISGSINLYETFGGDGINDAYMSDGVYIRPDGSTYCE